MVASSVPWRNLCSLSIALAFKTIPQRERERERERERGGSLDFSFFQVWLRFVWTCKGIVLCYWSLIKVDNLVVAFEEAT